MIEIYFNNDTHLISDNLLKCSSLLDEIYKFKTDKEFLPMYELEDETFAIISEFLIINTNFKKYSYEDFVFISKDFLAENTKSFLKNFDSETLTKILNIATQYEIFILSETIAYILSKRKISFIYIDNIIYLTYFDRKIKISDEAVLNIIKYFSTDRILKVDKEILKKFEYNPIYLDNSKYSELFDVKTLYYDNYKNNIPKNFKIVVKYGTRKTKADKILNLILTHEDVEDCEIFTVPKNVKIVEKHCFANKKINSIILHNDLILNDFDDCKFLKNIDLSIVDSKNITFANCENLENVVLSDCEKLNDYCFVNCRRLTNIDVQQIKTFGKSCFKNCCRLKNIKLSNDLIIIPEKCFSNCTSLSNINTNKVITFKSECFANCLRLSNINLNKATIIENECFKNCESLEFIAMPNSITNIGKSCFENCNRLKTVKLSENLITIPENCFLNCMSLKDIYFEYVKHFEKSCFKGCGFEKLAIVDSEIKNSAFENCVGLVNLELCQVQLSNESFKNCYNLRHIGISSIVDIPERCFENCCNLYNLIIKGEVNVLDYAFLNCSKLENVKGKIKTSKHSFKGCSKHLKF